MAKKDSAKKSAKYLNKMKEKGDKGAKASGAKKKGGKAAGKAKAMLGAKAKG